MSQLTCAACTTSYAPDLTACPHCGSAEYVQDGVRIGRKFPAFVSVSCDGCGRGPWQLRLPVLMPGLIQLPSLFCASCGSQVQVPWPPVEDDMSPKITVHGGPTNARETDLSPAVDASQPLAGAEADQGHPTQVEGDEVVSGEAVGEPLAEVPAQAYGEDAVPLDESEPDVDRYAGMTLAELRAEADSRGVASYGTKAQIAERLREDDAAGAESPAE